MKKFASLVAAGALLLSATGVAFAIGLPSGINVTTTSTSSTGGSQSGKGVQIMSTGDSESLSSSFVVVKLNNTPVTVKTTSTSSTGGKQTGASGSPSFQVMNTGNSLSEASGSVIVKGVSFSFGR